MEKLLNKILELVIAFLSHFVKKSKVIDEVPLPKPIDSIQPPVKKSRIEDWAKLIERFEGANPSWNNPGAIRSLSGSFLKFKTYEEGFAYLCDYLRRACTGKHAAYPKGGEHTIKEFQYIYSPPSENDTEKYLKFIVDGLKITRETRIKELL